MAPTAIAVPETYSQFRNVEQQIKQHGNAVQPQGKDIWKSLVFDILKERAASIDTDACDAGAEDAFYVADMGEVYRQHLRWKMNLGRVKPFFGEFFPK